MNLYDVPDDQGGLTMPTDRSEQSRPDAIDFIDHATVLCTDPTLAERLAELLERHGLADVPDHIPDAVTWAPPDPDDRHFDFRLPEHPTTEGTLP